MTEGEKGKITLKEEQFDKFIELIAQGGSGTPIRAISTDTEKHAIDGVEAQKAWYKQMAFITEQLSRDVVRLRDKELVDVRVEVKDAINKLEERIVKDEDALDTYKKEIIKPLDKNLVSVALKVRLIIWVGALTGTSLVALLVYLAKMIIAATTGAPPPPAVP